MGGSMAGSAASGGLTPQATVKPLAGGRSAASVRAMKEIAVTTEVEREGDAGSGLGGGSVGGGASGAGGLSLSSGGGIPSVPSMSLRGGGDSGAVGVAGASGALDVLSECVRDALRGHDVARQLDPSRPEAVAFIDALTAVRAFPDELAAAVMSTVAQRAPIVAHACLGGPNGFLHVMSVVTPLLNGLPEESGTFAAATDAMCALGRAMVKADPHSTQVLFRDFSLPSILPVLKLRPRARHALLQIVYAFTPRSVPSRIATIRVLQDRLGDMPLFLHCLSILVFFEPDFNPQLLDLYLYYCVIGCGMPSPSLRAACVSMLGMLAASDAELVAGELAKLSPLLSDSWWEVKAQLLVAASAVLQRIPPSPSTAAGTGGAAGGAMKPAAAGVAVATDIMRVLLTENHGPAVLRVGVAYAAPALALHPSLVTPFVRGVCSLPSEARAAALAVDGPGDELELSGVSGGTYLLPQLPSTWPPGVVARGLASVVQKEGLMHLDAGLFELILALLQPKAGAGGRGGSGEGGGKEEEDAESASLDPEVTAALEPLNDFLFVGMCDVENCPVALECLRRLVLWSPAGGGVRLLSAPTLPGCLLLVHRSSEGDAEGEAGDSFCVERVAEWLQALASHSNPLASAVSELLSAYQDQYPDDLPEASSIRDVAVKLGVAH
jgi:hypothetical protein